MAKSLPLPVHLPGRFEFHISRAARQKYLFEEDIYTLSGNVILANFQAARRFADQINRVQTDPDKTVRAGQINAMGLIDEILHLVIGMYKRQVKPNVIAEALDWLDSRIGADQVYQALIEFSEAFPSLVVYRGAQTSAEYLLGDTEGVPNRQLVLEEMLLLWLANANPAFEPYIELFDDAELSKSTVYLEIVKQLDHFFNYQPKYGPQTQQLIEMLRAPVQAAPNSLNGQLAYIRQYWASLLGDYLVRLLSSIDMIAEEDKATFSGPGPAEVIDFDAWGLIDAPERFSADSDWMPRLVLLAKNAFVWLDQLSRQYKREITRLDQIPDEELDRIARQGVTGLWLIGLWRRSQASKRIKQIMGDPDAIASAYSLDDYVIAEDLGGEEAAANLRERAIRRGIRLGGDMVPNHMAIDSRWVVEHPHWFLQLDHSPFPGYSFNGPNLSPRDGIGIYLEDNYYSRSDAAVVFKRTDFNSGQERYIYHGNDGTNMPWNDTAQLDFTNPEVREGVIQTILHVARQFPIIRFDAAMTLAKKHIQRLWFPEPGSGGAIPSRAGHGMTREEFEQAIPVEFWREVVDRVAAEVPDTLLLAEAFWMMEGFFVRTLGMHRVYNSAFMHMLRDEDNANYRQLIKNTLEYNPQILKRYVNFMNNPDEETAAEQFGKGDKYFGVATLMATLPGLPMVGHGQIEGFAEKYGMEFRSAKWHETPDTDLIERHQRQIFPLFHRRRLFAEVDNFLLYDFYTGSGYVNEDVYAYSNRMGEDRALVVYHNRFGDTRGWIKTSSAYLAQNGSDENRVLVQRSLGEGLNIPNDPNTFMIFRNLVTGQEYIRNCAEVHVKGLFVELFAYQSYVFIDFRLVHDSQDGRYGRVNAYLGGKGVSSVDEALQEMFLQVIHHPYRELVNSGMLNYLIESRLTDGNRLLEEVALDQTLQKSTALLRAVAGFISSSVDVEPIASRIQGRVQAVLGLPLMGELYPWQRSRKYQDALTWLNSRLSDEPFTWSVLLTSSLTGCLGRVIENAKDHPSRISRDWIDEWLLRNVIRLEFEEMNFSPANVNFGIQLIKVLVGEQCWFNLKGSTASKAKKLLERWLEDPLVRSFLQVNRFDEVEWFNREAMDNWLWWMLALAAVDINASPDVPIVEIPKQFTAAYDVLVEIRERVEQSGYQVDKLLGK